MPQLQGTPEEGVLGRRHRLQGLRLLPERQPRLVVQQLAGRVEVLDPVVFVLVVLDVGREAGRVELDRHRVVLGSVFVVERRELDLGRLIRFLAEGPVAVRDGALGVSPHRP
ncbi:hypothetical protein AQF52_3419 [Streptomyces venezuelae]|nr:hypothetical protein AQF52_3419 [Streptomyces venezuelae]CUM40593.1 hypothetical protein BN2537_10151 [Streptomyces venezuelae]